MDHYATHYGEIFDSTTTRPEISFSGHIQNNENSYFAMGARTYDPQIGRFLSVDPLFEYMPGQTPYHYAFNNPVMFSDPSGLAPVDNDKGYKPQLLYEPYTVDTDFFGLFSLKFVPDPDSHSDPLTPEGGSIVKTYLFYFGSASAISSYGTGADEGLPDTGSPDLRSEKFKNCGHFSGRSGKKPSFTFSDRAVDNAAAADATAVDRSFPEKILDSIGHTSIGCGHNSPFGYVPMAGNEDKGKTYYAASAQHPVTRWFNYTTIVSFTRNESGDLIDDIMISASVYCSNFLKDRATVGYRLYEDDELFREGNAEEEGTNDIWWDNAKTIPIIRSADPYTAEQTLVIPNTNIPVNDPTQRILFIWSYPIFKNEYEGNVLAGTPIIVHMHTRRLIPSP